MSQRSAKPQPRSGWDYHWQLPASPPALQLSLLDDLTCPICSLVTRDAVAHICGQLFCSDCWEKWSEYGKGCAQCRGRGPASPAYKDRRLVLNLRLNCPRGCGSTIRLGSLNQHFRSCTVALSEAAAADEAGRTSNLDEGKVNTSSPDVVPASRESTVTITVRSPNSRSKSAKFKIYYTTTKFWRVTNALENCWNNGKVGLRLPCGDEVLPQQCAQDFSLTDGDELNAFFLPV
eukprot:gb/GEZN01015759.1/.p1 GENE.gb/GEZN01015759.1/~~gb/GEZN01015759.1/.p1  ORF type:complete len:233 (-),score=20.35 gb/GEZN01015759.1/:47-745(-)